MIKPIALAGALWVLAVGLSQAETVFEASRPAPATPSFEASPPIPTATLFLSPNKDSFINESQPNQNNGTDFMTRIRIEDGEHRFAFYSFDLSGLPPAETVTSATLKLWVDREAPSPVALLRVLSDWDENTITWDNAYWNFDPLIRATFTPSTKDSLVTIDVTELVHEWHTGIHPNHGFMLYSLGFEERSRYATKEWSVPSQRPELEVTTGILPSSDLSVSKTVDKPMPAPGETITYTIILGNAGPDDATGISVIDVLPSGITYKSSWSSSGTYSEMSGIWAVGSIANARSDTLRIAAVVD